MTTIMAAEFDGGVVVAADSTTGLTKISDQIYCCGSGSAANTQAIADIISSLQESYSRKKEPPLVRKAANLFMASCSDRNVLLPAGIIVAGWDKEEGGQVLSLVVNEHHHMFLRIPCATTGSGSTRFSQCKDGYYKESMEKEECLQCVAKILSQMMVYDECRVGTFHCAVITEDGVERKTILGNYEG